MNSPRSITSNSFDNRRLHGEIGYDAAREFEEVFDAATVEEQIKG